MFYTTVVIMVGKNLKDIRIKLGLTQNEIAEYLTDKQSNISRLENKNRETLIEKYLTFLVEKGVDINKIFKK